MARLKRTGKGGRTGQRHSATPTGLRDYEVPPASDVVITRPDGNSVVEPAARPVRAYVASRRRSKPRKRATEPVSIEKVRAKLGKNVPSKADGAAERTGGTWTRHNNDALPRGRR